MHAVVRTGGKQYRVREGEFFYVEKLEGVKGDQIELEVLMISEDGKTPSFGTPVLTESKVACQVVEQFKGKKIIVYKCKRRKKYRKKNGHRQNYTRLRVMEISLSGKLTGKKPEARKVSAPVGFEAEATN